MLTIEGARLIFSDLPDGGLRLVIDHGGEPEQVLIDAAGRGDLKKWLDGAPAAKAENHE